ncbi:lysylphosphatidylglycerol synthase domain-containing protein [Leptospira dzoumogneensis]|uniref:Uncharacterized protein n=1 Tax=Leptospira dzoumogneensis TaxID=2484904 RepID=A0A4Z1ANZ6_9LEPT|nr:lysylphosphatidylglycerol synthase domain-containing protein [Leptospira dzoumogneensis]TGN03302.1 hypothetical protein EHR06_04655 [Leptospira dzoumogneensis]
MFNRKRILLATKLLLTGAAILYFIFFLKNHLEKMPEIRLDSKFILCSCISLILYSINIILGGLNWSILLRDHNVKLSKTKIVHISSLTQFGKYLPGNVGHHFGRVFLAKGHSIPIAISLQTIFTETVVLTASGLSVGIFGLLYLKEIEYSNFLPYIIFLIGIIFLSIIAPKFVIPILNHNKFTWLRKLTGGEELQIPKFSTIPKVTLLNIASFTNCGIILYMIAWLIFDQINQNIFFLISIFTASWILGYILPGSPAGLGIRDAALINGLSTQYDSSVTLGIAIIFRFICTIGDGIVFLISWSLKKKYLDND